MAWKSLIPHNIISYFESVHHSQNAVRLVRLIFVNFGTFIYLFFCSSEIRIPHEKCVDQAKSSEMFEKILDKIQLLILSVE